MNQDKGIKRTVLSYIFIQLAVAVYSFSGVASKLASGSTFLSPSFIMFYALEIMCLGIYAILWQQIVKRHELSVAYVNRSLSLLWSLLWSTLIFKETITIKNMIGALIIICGVILVNTAGGGDGNEI